jgi:hypothetical protein
MARQVYESDFETAESRREFEDLIDKATEVFELPVPDHVEQDAIHEAGPERNYMYGSLGAYIVRNSHALIALWDGVIPEKLGGTGDVVRFNLQGIPEEYAPSKSLLEPTESDPVWHIVTPRSGRSTTPDNALTTSMLFPARFETREHGRKTFMDILQATDGFNRDALAFASELEGDRARSRDYLMEDSTFEEVAPSLRATRDLFATADSMAGYFARHTHSTLKRLFVVVCCAAIIFDIYTHVYTTVWPLLLGYLVLLTLTYGLVVRSQKMTFQSRYLDYRALAEGLRVRFFWRLVGVEDEIADHYLHKQRSELDWIRYALRVWNPERTAGDTPGEQRDLSLKQRLQIVEKFWVEDQRSYFSKAARREEGFVHRAERWAGAMIIIGILLALFQVIHQGVIDPHPGKHPIHWLLVAVALAPIFAGLLLGYVEKRAHGDHAKQYERMSILFNNASQHLQHFYSEEEYTASKALLEELGREALAENGDWVLIHRDRPIEVPKA